MRFFCFALNGASSRFGAIIFFRRLTNETKKSLLVRSHVPDSKQKISNIRSVFKFSERFELIGAKQLLCEY